MDVPAILREVFDLGEDDIITQKSSHFPKLFHTVRLKGGVKIEVAQPIPQVKGANPLWSNEEEPEDLTIIKVTKPNTLGTIDDQVADRDELVAFLSWAFADQPIPIQWRDGERSQQTCVATPEQGTLLRVMRQRNWREYTWAIVIGEAVYGPNDFRGTLIEMGSRSMRDAKAACEAAWQALKAGGGKPPQPKATDTLGDIF